MIWYSIQAFIQTFSIRLTSTFLAKDEKKNGTSKIYCHIIKSTDSHRQQIHTATNVFYASFNCKHPFYIYFMSQLNKTTGTTPYYGVIPAAA